MSCLIRLATVDDLPRINEIYNHYVIHSTCTYQEVPETIEARRAWFDSHGEKFPVTAAIVDGEVVGWGSLSRYHARSAYRYSVENSVYIDHRFHRKGVGRAIMLDLIERAKKLGYHTVIAGADAEQAASLALHMNLGFVEVARLRQVGFKFNRWLDVIYMQLFL